MGLDGRPLPLEPWQAAAVPGVKIDAERGQNDVDAAYPPPVAQAEGCPAAQKEAGAAALDGWCTFCVDESLKHHARPQNQDRVEHGLRHHLVDKVAARHGLCGGGQLRRLPLHQVSEPGGEVVERRGVDRQLEPGMA